MRTPPGVQASRRTSILGLVTIVVAAGVVPALAFALVYRYTVDVPYIDEWTFTRLILGADRGHILWADAFAQRNEHRIFFPALLILGLSRLGGWSELRETLFDVGLVTLDLAILWRMIVSTLPARTVPYVFLGASLLTFSLVQVETLLWGMGSEWFVANLSALFALYVLTLRAPSASNVVVALGASAVSLFSLSAGLSLLPVGVLALLLRDPSGWRRSSLWVAGSIVMLAIFLRGFNAHPGFPGRAGELATMFPQYVLAFLGGPLGTRNGTQPAEFLGMFSLAVIAIAAIRFGALRARGRSAEAYVPWLALCAFVVCDALLAAYGRAGLGIVQATSSRYATMATDLWFGVIALLVLLLADAWKAGRFAVRLVVPAAAVLVCGFAYLFVRAQFTGFRYIAEFTSPIQRGMLAVHDFPDPTDEQLSLLCPCPAYLRWSLPALAAAGDPQFEELVPVRSSSRAK